jgi:hypothetical protein
MFNSCYLTMAGAEAFFKFFTAPNSFHRNEAAGRIDLNPQFGWPDVIGHMWSASYNHGQHNPMNVFRQDAIAGLEGCSLFIGHGRFLTSIMSGIAPFLTYGRCTEHKSTARVSQRNKSFSFR